MIRLCCHLHPTARMSPHVPWSAMVHAAVYCSWQEETALALCWADCGSGSLPLFLLPLLTTFFRRAGCALVAELHSFSVALHALSAVSMAVSVAFRAFSVSFFVALCFLSLLFCRLPSFLSLLFFQPESSALLLCFLLFFFQVFDQVVQ